MKKRLLFFRLLFTWLSSVIYSEKPLLNIINKFDNTQNEIYKSREYCRKARGCFFKEDYRLSNDFERPQNDVPDGCEQVLKCQQNVLVDFCVDFLIVFSLRDSNFFLNKSSNHFQSFITNSANRPNDRARNSKNTQRDER